MKYTKISDVKNPQGNRIEDAGIDFFVPNDFPETKLYIGEQINIPSGIKVDVPFGYALELENKSGVSLKRGLTRGACVVDHGYRGIIHLNLFKVVKGTEDLQDENGYYTIIKPGDKIVQGILRAISTESIEEISNEEYDNLPKTDRGAGGFGHTGSN